MEKREPVKLTLEDGTVYRGYSFGALTPVAGEVVSGPISISWKGSDLDGGSLTYSVFYVRDQSNAIPIALGVTNTTAPDHTYTPPPSSGWATASSASRSRGRPRGP